MLPFLCELVRNWRLNSVAGRLQLEGYPIPIVKSGSSDGTSSRQGAAFSARSRQAGEQKALPSRLGYLVHRRQGGSSFCAKPTLGRDHVSRKRMHSRMTTYARWVFPQYLDPGCHSTRVQPLMRHSLGANSVDRRWLRADRDVMYAHYLILLTLPPWMRSKHPLSMLYEHIWSSNNGMEE